MSGDRIKCRVCLVVVLIDDFNGKVILGSNACVGILGEKPPIRKAEGYHVFTNLQSSHAEVRIEGALYEKQEVSVDLGQENESYTLLKVRMVPNRSYPIPGNTTCVEGKAEPGSLVYLLCREPAKALKLLYDYESDHGDGLDIHIFHPEDMDIEGKTLSIENKDRTRMEFLRIQKRQDEGNRYRLSEKLSAGYKKIGTVIYQVYSGRTDANGEFFIPVSNRNREKNQFFCQAVGCRRVQKECEFKTSILNRLDLTKEEN